ncbi:uncharacterized protein E0L32_011094 [Thyridium curvatum]|uniref:Histone H4 n=1 Tax=Thyridium curvatum TaxID=1093900 RepID=A0A507AQ26_9PEZI|nr:uncharacterized protein E0L32_011094 [Thyridium curvatum]TPX06949.1 hypothetical protein E0L32_011094 [Thyridium curvatum]
MPPTVPKSGGPKGLTAPSSSAPSSAPYKPGMVGGKGKAVLSGKRHRRIARRGGVKRISSAIYDDVREALKTRLRMIIHDCVVFAEHRNGKTITVADVVYSLKRNGKTIYGFGEAER